MGAHDAYMRHWLVKGYECRIYLATSILDLFNTADYNPDLLTLGVSVRDFQSVLIVYTGTHLAMYNVKVKGH